MEWDIGGGEDLDLDLEEFDISLPRGVRREAAERSRWRRDEEAYMEGVRREHLGSAYMEEPRRSHRDSMEEMDVAAVGVRGRGRWEPRSTSRPAFMVSKAADAAVWEDLKDIKPPMYDGNPLNLDRFLEKLTAPNVLVTRRRHDERYTIQAEGAAAPTLYTWATRGDLPHPTLHHAPSWPTPFHTADRPNKKPKHTGVHTHAQEAQHRHEARRKARTLHDDHTIPRIGAPPPGYQIPPTTARSQASPRTA